MFKRSDIFFALIQVPVDFLMLLIASSLVYYVRFSTLADIKPIQFELPQSEYFGLVLLIIPFWLVLFAMAGLYAINAKRRLIEEWYRIFLAVSAGITAIVLLIFFRHELFSSRFLVIANWFLAIILVALGRFALRKIQSFMHQYGYGVSRVIVVGNTQPGNYLMEFFKKDVGAGYKLVKHFSTLKDSSVEEISKLCKDGSVDLLINSDPDLSKDYAVELIGISDEYKIDYQYVPDFYEAKMAHVEVGALGGVPIVSLKRTPLDGWWRVVKRILDIVISSIILLIIGPILAVVALAIKIDSPGPIVYKNKRVGYKGKDFFAYKFRSMKLEYCTGEQYGGDKALKYEEKLIDTKSKRQGPIYKVLDDPRRTKVGKFIERTSIDELPQFFNVLKGDMSIVGPRPHQPREVEKFAKEHKRVFAIKPGITGLAQVSGRSDLDYADEFALDIYYMENWNLLNDLVILIKTPFTLLRRHNS